LIQRVKFHDPGNPKKDNQPRMGVFDGNERKIMSPESRLKGFSLKRGA